MRSLFDRVVVAGVVAAAMATMRAQSAVPVEDFATYSRGLGDGTRVAVKDGALTASSRDQWRSLRMEDQFTAILYLGPPESLTQAGVPRSICEDAVFVQRRLDRLIRFAPAPEVASFRSACRL